MGLFEGKPRRLPIPRHPCRPGSLLVHFLKPSPMNQAVAQWAKLLSKDEARRIAANITPKIGS
jgi:hypothetical protein